MPGEKTFESQQNEGAQMSNELEGDRAMQGTTTVLQCTWYSMDSESESSCQWPLCTPTRRAGDPENFKTFEVGLLVLEVADGKVPRFVQVACIL